MGGLFTLVGKLKIEGTPSAVADLKQVEASVEKASGKMFSMGGAMKVASGLVVAGAMAAAAAVTTLAMTKGLEAAASYDSTVRGLATVSSSAEDLRGQLTRLHEIAKLPGIGFQEAAKASLQLQAVGISAKLAERTLMGFANATARGGGSKADFSEAIRQMTQMASVGKLAGEDLKTISARIPGFSKVISQAFGTNDTEKINAMGLSATQMIERIDGALEKLPKASGGIRNAMDNLGDVLNDKLYIPLGRVAAAFMGAFGSGIENLLNSAASGLGRMARFAEDLSKSRIGTFFTNVVGNLKVFNLVVSVSAGLIAGMVGPAAVAKVVSGIRAIMAALAAFRAAVVTTGISAMVSEAIATGGASLVAARNAAGLALGAGGAVYFGLNKLFSENSINPNVPEIPEGVQYGGGGTRGAMASVVQTAIDAMSKMQLEKLSAQERLMVAIERNTSKTVSALDMRKQTLGGSELGKLGVTAAEIGNRVYSPPDTFQRPVASEYERVQSKQIRRELGRMGHVGRLRNA